MDSEVECHVLEVEGAVEGHECDNLCSVRDRICFLLIIVASWI